MATHEGYGQHSPYKELNTSNDTRLQLSESELYTSRPRPCFISSDATTEVSLSVGSPASTSLAAVVGSESRPVWRGFTVLPFSLIRFESVGDSFCNFTVPLLCSSKSTFLRFREPVVHSSRSPLVLLTFGSSRAFSRAACSAAVCSFLNASICSSFSCRLSASF